MIFKINTLTLTLLVLAAGISYGQKIKYKDLFILLNARQYEQAEPFLKKYLKENQDNPNAFLFMGYIYEEKSLANDVLLETEKQSTNTDSAVYYFDRAVKEIDEKELRKNEELYQAYSRRDLRTGKFGLKLSDIQFDLEKRTKSLKERQQRVKLLKERFVQTQHYYENCGILFKRIADQYKTRKEFFLQADDALLTNLRNLARKYDSCLISFNDYKIMLQGLGKTGHNQELDSREIAEFKYDGYSKVDYFQDELKFWDYKRWAMSSLETIENEVRPINESLVRLDAELNALSETLRKDSVSVRTETAAIAEKINKTGLQKFDPKPLPFDVYSLKIQELNYGSELAQTRKLRDSSNLVLKQRLLKRQIILLTRIDSVAGLLMQRDFDYEAGNYKNFIANSYGSASVLKNMIKSTGDFAVAEKANKEKQVSKIEQVLNWVYDQSDSIPASTGVTSARYFPLSIVPDSHTFGLTFTDTVAFAYFYAITSSRKATIKSNHKLDSTVFQKMNLPLIKGISAADGAQQAFYVVMYSEEKRDGKVPALVYKVTALDGLVWSNYYSLEGLPTEATYGKFDGELSIKVVTDSGNKVFVIQRDGKQL